MLESEVFDICYNINELILNSQMDTARTEVIKLLDRLNREGKEYSPMVNHFIREVGLFPYIDKNTASWQEQAVFEAYKTDLGGGEQKTLHSAQSRVLKRLLAGDNIALLLLVLVKVSSLMLLFLFVSLIMWLLLSLQ